MQYGGVAGRDSFGLQYDLPWSNRTTEQSRPLTSDTTASTGVRWITDTLPAAAPTVTAVSVTGSAPQPPSHATPSRTSGHRMRHSMLWHR